MSRIIRAQESELAPGTISLAIASLAMAALAYFLV